MERAEEQNMEMQNVPAAETSAPVAKVSSLKGLAQVFYNPTGWFEQVQQQPKVLLPYIVLTLLTAIVFAGMGNILVHMQMNSPELQERLQGQPLPPQAATWMWYSTVIGGTIVLSLVPLVAAALALFWGNVVFAGHVRFKSLLSVMVYGELIYAVGNLLVLPLVIAKKSVAVGLNLGVLVADRGLEDPLWVALSKVDLFIIWEIIVIGIGLSVLYRFPRNKGLLTSVLSMGLLTIIGILIAVVKSMIA